MTKYRKYWRNKMYREKIRKLELLVEEQGQKITKMQNDPNRDEQEYMSLNQQRSMTMRQLSELRRLQWEEDHERVNFDDDR